MELPWRETSTVEPGAHLTSVTPALAVPLFHRNEQLQVPPMEPLAGPFQTLSFTSSPPTATSPCCSALYQLVGAVDSRISRKVSAVPVLVKSVVAVSLSAQIPPTGKGLPTTVSAPASTGFVS